MDDTEGNNINNNNNLNFPANSIKVLEGRYLMRDENKALCETPKQLFERVAENIASADLKYNPDSSASAGTKNKFYRMMINREFLPNSPTLMNAGTSLQQLAGCFVLPVDDSMTGIFDAIKYTALIHQSGGGTGFSFSRLRPKGDVVKSTGGIASGPLSFMNVFNTATETIKQGGRRRGANMGILRVDHPDIIDFITAKEKETVLANFNISIGLTEKFMEAVEKDEDYPLLNPRSRKVVKSLKAREVFELIVQMAWKNGEPGIVFLDRLNDSITNPTPLLGEIESTNPCITGDSLVPTECGLERMEELVQKAKSQEIQIVTDVRVPIDNGNGTLLLDKQQAGTTLRMISRAFCSGVKEVYRLETKSGYEIKATADHKIMTPWGWKELKNLVPDDLILIQSGEGSFSQNRQLPFEVQNLFVGENGRTYKFNLPQEWSQELGEVLGFLVGDGWLRNEDKNCRVGFTFGLDSVEILNKLKPILNKWYNFNINEVQRKNNVYHLSYHSKYFAEFFEKLGIKSWKSENKEVPAAIFTAPEEAVIGFLRGLFSADGTVARNKTKGNNYVRLTSKSIKLLKDVQKLFINLGIFSKIYNRSRQPKETFSYTAVSGEVKQYSTDGILYELHISRDMIPLFLKKIGFLFKKHDYKTEQFVNINFYKTHFYDSVKSIKGGGKEIVYDLTEPITHSFVANGIVISNCGEQPLLPFESCNLGSINLERHVKGGQVDWPKLKETVHAAVHFLDNVIDMNKYPLEQIEKMVHGNRKIGLGVMGWADALIRLGIPYNSQEGVELARKLIKFIDDEARKKSGELADERGVFPNFPGSTYNTGKEEDKVRNATRTTIAPTGSTSVIAGASSGIEPLFALSYVRKTPQFELVEINPLFEEMAKEKGFYSEELMKKIAGKGSIQGMEEIPEEIRKVFVTAMDITPEDHIKMQAAFQEYTNNAVSKTINFPFSASKEEVHKSYLLAWKLGCKGLTIYRDGSREMQVLNIAKAAEDKGEKSKEERGDRREKKNEEKSEREKSKHEIMKEGRCPECSSPIEVSEGCYTCPSCGNSACSL